MRIALAVIVVALFGLAIAGVGTGGPPPHHQPAGARMVAPSGARLAAAKRRLAHGDGLVRSGRADFEREGCDACHSIAATDAGGRLGPRLDTLYDPRAVVIEDITNPRKAITPGFQANLMPTDYEDRLGRHEIRALAAFIKTVSGKP